MQKPTSWRKLLGQVIQDPIERQRIADELDVNPITLTRWVNQISGARPRNLLKLLQVLPQHRDVLLELFEEEFGHSFAMLPEPPLSAASDGISGTFYMRVLRTHATVPTALRFSSLGDLILEHALKQLDPRRLGMAIIVARCLPSSQRQEIYTLRESLGRGTLPWKSHLEQEAILLGAESLTGYAVATGHLVARQRLSKEESSLIPAYRGNWEESAVAVPIMSEGKIGGGLLVSSTQPDYFIPPLQQIIQSYADLLALAIEPEAFYESPRIALRVIPPQAVQQPYLAEFGQRLTETLRQAAKDQQHLSLSQAEQLVWQQFEDIFLQLSLSQAAREPLPTSQPA
jgi:hypothetical protein